MFKRTYNISPDDAAAVIGRKGAGIKALKDMPNVRHVYFDTKTSLSTYFLSVTATSFAVCDSVYCEVKKRITNKKEKAIDNFTDRIFIDEEDTHATKIIMRRISLDNEVVHRQNNLYKMSHFEHPDLADDLNELGISHGRYEGGRQEKHFHNFSKQKFIAFVEEDIKKHSADTLPSLRFTASPGKFAFKTLICASVKTLSRDKLVEGGYDYLKRMDLKQQFSPNLNVSLLSRLNERLAQNGFEILNEKGEMYTIVHFFSGEDNTFFRIKLADDLDDNLTSKSRDDMRLTQAKKDLVKRILNAKTIGEVMQCSGKVTSHGNAKLAYWRLAAQLHPDKNLHENATEAFKVLQHANDNLKQNRPPSTKTLDVTKDVESNAKRSKDPPPKVISIKTKKNTVCRITTCSSKSMDMRAKLTRESDTPRGLSEKVKNVLNTCWANREPNGDIPVPDGSVINLQCIKQVKAAYEWIKEDAIESSDVDIRVKIKVIREKTDDANEWKDSIEVDLEINGVAAMNNSHATGKSILGHWTLMKDCVEYLFNQN